MTLEGTQGRLKVIKHIEGCQCNNVSFSLSVTDKINRTENIQEKMIPFGIFKGTVSWKKMLGSMDNVRKCTTQLT